MSKSVKLQKSNTHFTIGWIGLDPDEVRRTAQILGHPSGGGTVDELGLGAVTARLSKLLFPAFTTLMTRAKYFPFATGAVLAAWQRFAQSTEGPKEDEDRDRWLERNEEKLVELAQRAYEEVEFILSLALTTRRREETDRDRWAGIFGQRNIKRNHTFKRFIGKDWAETQLRAKSLYADISRYPLLIYFTGLKRLEAFTFEENSLEKPSELWERFAAAHAKGGAPELVNIGWSKDFNTTHQTVGKLVYAFDRATEEQNSSIWFEAVKFVDFEVSANEAKRLFARIKNLELGAELKPAEAAVCRSVPDAFRVLKKSELKAHRNSYLILERAVKKSKPLTAASFRAAALALSSMDPVSEFYWELVRLLGDSKSHNVDIKIKVLLANINATENLKSIKSLKTWPPKEFETHPGIWWGKKAWAALKQLEEFYQLLASAQRDADFTEIAVFLARWEWSVLQSRHKEARLLASPMLALTKRGKKTARKIRSRVQQADFDDSVDDELDPDSADDESSADQAAVGPVGRLRNAIRLYSDLISSRAS